jgi:Carboxypeptidase regulatory-like domain
VNPATNHTRTLLLTTFVLTLCTVASFAQTQPGTITGTVVDRSGAAIVGAHVTLIRKDSANNLELLSGNDGQFSFRNIAPGDFQLTVTAPNFAAQTSSGLLHPGEFLVALPTTLTLATANTEVNVVPTHTEIADDQIKVQEKQRIVGFFPNYYVSYVPNAEPLTSRQKFKLAGRLMVDPATIIITGATAGIQQASDDYAGYGQGAQGYAKRLGANYLDNATDTFIGGAILPSLFKQDPRYFYKGTGTARSRVLYAIATVFICKGDNMHWQPNYSGILGGLASGGLSNLYYPKEDRGLSLTFNNAAIGMGTAAAINILQEFVIRKFTPKAPKASAKD